MPDWTPPTSWVMTLSREAETSFNASMPSAATLRAASLLWPYRAAEPAFMAAGLPMPRYCL